MAVNAPRTSRHIEVERKFDVVEPLSPPSFAGIAEIIRVEKRPAQALDAVYFDTPARDLASKRITLRRRTGGEDAGWHLKLPAGPDVRTEIRAPLETAGPRGDGSGQEVPGELLDVVLAIVRDRPLGPVARISTTREVHLLYGAGGTVLAEFCDDQVTASRAAASDADAAEQQRWREWKLELVAPEANTELMDRLSHRLLGAGAAPAGHGSKLARVLGMTQDAPARRRCGPERPEEETGNATPARRRCGPERPEEETGNATPARRRCGPERPEEETGNATPARRRADPIHQAVAEQVAELLLWDGAVRANADDSVHQMRVTTRRIRSLLQTSPDAFGLSDDASILGELRELANVLGEARDAEVLAERYRRALDELPAQLVRGPVRERLVAGAEDRYQAGLRRSLDTLRSPRYFRLLDALDALVAEPPPTPAGRQPATMIIGTGYKKVRKAAKAARQATEEDRDQEVHRVRKCAKRLRYTAATVGAKQVSKRAEAIQSLLGDHQDSVVSRAHLMLQADAAHAAGEDTFTYGLLYQQEIDRARCCRQQLEPALRKLKKSVYKL
jgi:CHAD domain-containing protein